MANYNFNPYGNYNPNNIPQYKQPTNTMNTYSFVNGIEGAKAYQVMPSQKIMLMDCDRPLIYMKTSDEYGKSTLRYFKMTEISEQDLINEQNRNNTQFALKTDLEALSDKIDKLSQLLEKPLKTQNKEE